MEDLGEKYVRLWEIIDNLTADQRSDVLCNVFGYMGQHEQFLKGIESALAANKAYWEAQENESDIPV
jgi:hypothetical protein